MAKYLISNLSFLPFERLENWSDELFIGIKNQE